MNETAWVHENCSYLVVGLGLSGYSVASYLLARGYRCAVVDDRAEPPCREQLIEQWPEADVMIAPLTLELTDKYDCLVVSPGLSIRTQLMKKAAQSGKRIIGDIELFAEAVDKPVLAITGSNGKSTVTALLGEMIRADGKQVGVGGNFGVPALELLEQQADLYVLELSSFQLETTTSLKPLASTVLNVSEDHMDRYDGIEDYRHTKQGIYHAAQYRISNADDTMTLSGEDDIRFSLIDDKADYHVSPGNSPRLVAAGEPWIATSELRLKGRHNWANCLAAMALARAAGISQNAILRALREFPGLPHRSQWVAEIDGVNWINDSKATNPGAAKAAIEGLDEPVILLAGGQGKGADMLLLRDTLSAQVKTVLLFGEDAEIMQTAWSGCAEIEQVADLSRAVQRARELAVAGDVVLLSPACASFDQFKGFAQRGELFAQYVRALT